jgi:sodium/potassium-transporting ATPase subunit alpha
LAIVIAVIVLVTGCFSYYQNSKSEAIMDSFKGFQQTKVTVIRENENSDEKTKQKQISIFNLVPGDVCIIKGGQKIPADVRVFRSQEFKVDNSSLTVIFFLI